jgi:ATP-dependent DNA helicase PIF1
MLGNVIEATILTGKGEGETVFIPGIPLIPTDLPFNFKRLHFPVRFAFAITINTSRVCSPKNLFILAPGDEIKNVVYNQVLSSINHLLNL